MVLSLLRHANQKPPIGPLSIDIGNPLTQGLAGFWIANEYGSRKLNDYSGNQKNMSMGTGKISSDIWQTSRFGPALSTPVTANYFHLGPTGSEIVANTPFTLFATLIHDSTVSVSHEFLGFRIGPNQTTLTWDTNQYKFFVTLDSSAHFATSSSFAPPLGLNSGDYITVAGTWDGATAHLYINGVLDPGAGPTNTGTSGFITDASEYFGILFGNGSGVVSTLTLLNAGIWHRVLSNSEFGILTYENYPMFQARPLQRWISVAASTITTTRLPIARGSQ